MMKAAELQKKTAAELRNIEREERAKLQQLRFDLSGGNGKNVREIRSARRTIARVLTILKKKTL